MAIRSAEINVMVTSATKVARALTRDFGEIEQLQTSRAGSTEFTERAFNYGTSVLKETLAKARPDRDVLLAGVANPRLDKTSELWIANPICGRANFSHGIPHFAVTVAHVREQETLATVIYDSVHDDLYWAEKGIGAYRNDRRIRVSERRQVEDTMVGNYEVINSDPCVHQAQSTLAQHAGGVRVLGSIALDLAYVAAGRLDGFWSLSAVPSDCASGALLVQEAGGFASGMSGTSKPTESAGILAANGRLHARLGALLRQVQRLPLDG